MKWRELPPLCRVYLSAVYCASIPFALSCFWSSNSFPVLWLLLTLTSAFGSTINVRFPKISSVISMGDVFIILSLTQFGAGPALITYWVAVVSANVTDSIRQFGADNFWRRLYVYRLAFNLGCCTICVWSMSAAYNLGLRSHLPAPGNQLIALGALALAWF